MKHHKPSALFMNAHTTAVLHHSSRSTVPFCRLDGALLLNACNSLVFALLLLLLLLLPTCDSRGFNSLVLVHLASGMRLCLWMSNSTTSSGSGPLSAITNDRKSG